MSRFGTILLLIGLVGLAIAFPFLWLVYIAVIGWLLMNRD